MSHEQDELRRLARLERHAAIAAAKRIPRCAGDAASAFARQHPVWAAGGAAALAMGFVARKRRASGIEGSGSRWPAAIAAFGVRFLPDMLKLIGLTMPAEKKKSDDSQPDQRPSPGNGRS